MIIATDRARRPADFTRERVTATGGRICPFCPGNESKTPPEVLAYRSTGGANEQARFDLVTVVFEPYRIEHQPDAWSFRELDRVS